MFGPPNTGAFGRTKRFIGHDPARRGIEVTAVVPFKRGARRMLE